MRPPSVLDTWMPPQCLGRRGAVGKRSRFRLGCTRTLGTYSKGAAQMALAGFSKSLIAAAACLLVALTGFAAVAVTPGFAVKEEILGKDANGNPTTSQTDSLDPNGTTLITVTVLRSNPDEVRPGTLTLNFTLPSGVDFVSVTSSAVGGCTLPKGFDPSKAQPTCTIKDPFAFVATPAPGVFGTKVTATITVARDFDPTAPVPTSCPTADLGNVTVQATTDVGDNVTATPAVTLQVNPYADIDVTSTAPATISVDGTIKSLGPCAAPTVQVSPETSDGAGVSVLSFASISGACTV